MLSKEARITMRKKNDVEWLGRISQWVENLLNHADEMDLKYKKQSALLDGAVGVMEELTKWDVSDSGPFKEDWDKLKKTLTTIRRERDGEE